MDLKWYPIYKDDCYVSVKDLSTSSIEEMNPFYLKLYELPDKVEGLIKEALSKILKHLDRYYFFNLTYTLLREALNNGIKANIKRAMFFYKGLDIDNPIEYHIGMRIFKSELANNIEMYKDRIKKENRYVILKLSFNKDFLIIEIMNNSIITNDEIDKISIIIEKSKEFSNISDVFMSKPNDSEGAGLGISMIMLLLKNEGINTNFFSIGIEGGSTISTFKIPLEIKEEQIGYKIAQKMIQEIDSLPTFDENIRKIQELIKQPNSKIDEIAEIVQKDVSLTGNILKLVNSPAFFFGRRIYNISKAIQILGLSELSNILYTIGTKKIMENRYPAFEEIWEKSNESAFISSLLAKRKHFDKEQTNNLVVAGLLHDIGNVILISLEEHTVRDIMKILGIRKEPTNLIFEETMLGISHTTIGALAAKKWNFPDSILKAIRYHHSPDLITDEEDKKVIYTVYLSDYIVGYNHLKENFESIYSPCLEYFDFDEENFVEFLISVKREYQKKFWKK